MSTRRNRRNNANRASARRNRNNGQVDQGGIPIPQPKLSGLYKGLRNDLSNADQLANQFLDLTPFTQVDASRTAETQNILNNLQSLADPTSAAYAGARNAEMQDYVRRLNEATQGYDSRELQALREQRMGGLERGFQSGRAALARGNSGLRNNTQRSAQLLELAKSYGQQRADANNDLFVQGADEKQRRLEGYGGFINNLGQQEFERGAYARDQYANALKAAQQDQLERQKINLSQEAASRALYNTGRLSTFGLGEARRNANRQNNFLKSLERIRSSNSRAPVSNTNYYVQALQDEANRYSS